MLAELKVQEKAKTKVPQKESQWLSGTGKRDMGSNCLMVGSLLGVMKMF